MSLYCMRCLRVYLDSTLALWIAVYVTIGKPILRKPVLLCALLLVGMCSAVRQT